MPRVACFVVISAYNRDISVQLLCHSSHHDTIDRLQSPLLWFGTGDHRLGVFPDKNALTLTVFMQNPAHVLDDLVKNIVTTSFYSSKTIMPHKMAPLAIEKSPGSCKYSGLRDL